MSHESRPIVNHFLFYNHFNRGPQFRLQIICGPCVRLRPKVNPVTSLFPFDAPQTSFFASEQPQNVANCEIHFPAQVIHILFPHPIRVCSALDMATIRQSYGSLTGRLTMFSLPVAGLIRPKSATSRLPLPHSGAIIPLSFPRCQEESLSSKVDILSFLILNFFLFLIIIIYRNQAQYMG